MLEHLQRRNAVDMVLPLSGHLPGVVKMDGKTILVSEDADPWKPRKETTRTCGSGWRL